MNVVSSFLIGENLVPESANVCKFILILFEKISSPTLVNCTILYNRKEKRCTREGGEGGEDGDATTERQSKADQDQHHHNHHTGQKRPRTRSESCSSSSSTASSAASLTSNGAFIEGHKHSQLQQSEGSCTKSPSS